MSPPVPEAGAEDDGDEDGGPEQRRACGYSE